MTKTDILDAIDAVLAENRQVKQRRMQAHVLWLLDNPTQLPIKGLSWDESTTAITNRDLDENAYVADQLWKFSNPEQGITCVSCCTNWVEGDRLYCGLPDCEPYDVHTASHENMHRAIADVADLPQPLHRGRVHIRPMVSDR